LKDRRHSCLSARKKKFLIYVVRYEFEIDGESVVPFVDEDGTAFLEMKDVPLSVRMKIAARLRASDQVTESKEGA